MQNNSDRCLLKDSVEIQQFGDLLVLTWLRPDKLGLEQIIAYEQFITDLTNVCLSYTVDKFF